MNLPERGPICYPELRVYDPSSLGTFECCPFSYHLRYNRKLISEFATAVPLTWGGAVHEGIAALLSQEWSLESALAAYRAYPGIAIATDKHRTPEKGEALLEAYRERWGKEDSYKVLDLNGKKAVEEAYILPLGDGFSLAGRLDAITSYQNQVWVMDHKTTSSMYYLQNSLRPHLQFDLYSWAAKQLFGTCGGVIVDAIDIGKKGGFEFARIPTPRSEYEIEEARLCAIDHAKLVDFCTAEGRWPKFRTNCFKWNRQCDYANVCMHGVEAGLKVVEIEEER